MNVMEKLKILTDAAKYDVACTSSGVDRSGKKGMMGSASACGICHSFAADGRCISLLKVLMSNCCIYDCKYCVNRVSKDTPRTSFTPRELAELTIEFYRRNYIEGLFLSSGVLKNPDYTMEQMITVMSLLRNEYRFNGYIHVKAIPGASSELVEKLGLLVDRMSINIELPSEQSLQLLAPQKEPSAIVDPLRQISQTIAQNKADRSRYRHAPSFVPAGQSTQMIVGATPDSDHSILTLSEGLYKKYGLKRVFFSAYTPVVDDPHLPSVLSAPPLLREHRLYQADWLMRFYGFSAREIVPSHQPNMHLGIDPKCNWALNNMHHFPVEINHAPYATLLRVPGIGVKSAQRIVQARRYATLNFDHLKKIGVVLKRARFFITCRGKTDEHVVIDPDFILRGLLSKKDLSMLLSARGSQICLDEMEPPRLIPERQTLKITAPSFQDMVTVGGGETQSAPHTEFGIHI